MDKPQDRPSSPPPPPGKKPSLEGRRALIVGGSGGIGAAFSEALAARGADLIIHGGSSQARLEASMEAARAAARGGASVEGFLLRLEKPRDLLDIIASLGQIDILVSAFGPFLRKPLHETGSAEWERLALLDLALPGALASALLPAMMRGGWGRFLFFGGTRTDQIRGYSSNAAYAAAKTGLGVLVKSLAAEYAVWNIGAFLLCPGFVETDYLAEEERKRLRDKSPKGELIDPKALASLGVDLLAADPTLVSGAIINADSGLKL